MDVEKLVAYTPSQLEKRSQDTLRRRPDIGSGFPVNIELLIENMANVSLEVHDNLLPVHSIEGYVCKEQFLGKRLEVRVDRGIIDGNRPRYLAVLGEEFSHIELHMSLVYAVQTVGDFIRLQQDPAWPQYERDAKRFSDALRMPASMLVPEAERLYPQVVNAHGFGDPARIARFLCNALAELFCVPTEDMRRRMMDWPCYIANRVLLSVQATSDSLVPSTWSLRAIAPHFQRSFIDEVQRQEDR